MGKLERLLKLAKSGLIRTRDLNDFDIPRAYLQRLCDRGVLERVDRGLYRHVDRPVTELHSLGLVAKRLPKATIGLLSALQVYELTTEVPHAVWIMIGRNDRIPQFSYPKLEVFRASGLAQTHGVESRQVEGISVKLTSPAKTVADCFRYRRHVGIDVAIAALKDYFTQSKRSSIVVPQYGLESEDVGKSQQPYSIDSLVEAARADRVLTLMRPYMEALA